MLDEVTCTCLGGNPKQSIYHVAEPKKTASCLHRAAPQIDNPKRKPKYDRKSTLRDLYKGKEKEKEIERGILYEREREPSSSSRAMHVAMMPHMASLFRCMLLPSLTMLSIWLGSYFCYHVLQSIHRQYCSPNLIHAVLFSRSDACIYMSSGMRFIEAIFGKTIKAILFAGMYKIYRHVERQRQRQRQSYKWVEDIKGAVHDCDSKAMRNQGDDGGALDSLSWINSKICPWDRYGPGFSNSS